MTSKIKVDNISKVSDDSNIISKCGTAISVGASGNTVAVTGNDIRSDNYKAADGGVIVSQSGTTITLGASGDTVSLASGASQTGFGRTGTVDWDTTPKTSTFTAVAGDGFFCNTTSGGFTCNLPAGVAGAIVSLADYAGTWQTGNLTVSPNGSDNLGGANAPVVLNTEGQSVTFVFVDSTQGWINVQDSTSNERGNAFPVATGGTITTSGDFKIHTFTGPGTFTVSCASSTPANNVVSYVVVGGGGGAGYSQGGGGGGGGFREFKSPIDTYTASPLDGNPGGTSITVAAQAYPITVGGGGPGGPSGNTNGTKGSDSVFSTITSTGGGYGGYSNPGNSTGGPGGSGGGGGGNGGNPGGNGNDPSVSPPQGNPGGIGWPGQGRGGGGGGATGTGQPSQSAGGPAGAGATSSITGSPVGRAGGGGGGSGVTPGGSASDGGAAGKGPSGTGDAGTANTGGGGGGGGYPNPGGAGGSGIVIVRYKFQ